ncbi:MAG: PIN domain-containing protein [Brumimicrobium sp.]
MEKIKPSDLNLNFSTTLFFDTNIWLFLFSSIANYKEERQKHYSRLFNDAVQKKCSIYITSMVMSEFANVILRREFNKWKKDNGNHAAQYKNDFVGTETYEEKTEQVKNQLNKILKLPNILKAPDSFNHINLDNIFSNFGLADFNDAYINEIVSSNNLILVTDDGDFEKIYSGKKLVTLS